MVRRRVSPVARRATLRPGAIGRGTRRVPGDTTGRGHRRRRGSLLDPRRTGIDGSGDGAPSRIAGRATRDPPSWGDREGHAPRARRYDGARASPPSRIPARSAPYRARRERRWCAVAYRRSRRSLYGADRAGIRDSGDAHAPSWRRARDACPSRAPRAGGSRVARPALRDDAPPSMPSIPVRPGSSRDPRPRRYPRQVVSPGTRRVPLPDAPGRRVARRATGDTR